jgi:hypothetical protein
MQRKREILLSWSIALKAITMQTLTARTTAFYNSPAFLEKANQSAAFLNALPPYLDGRNVTLENMVSMIQYIPHYAG